MPRKRQRKRQRAIQTPAPTKPGNSENNTSMVRVVRQLSIAAFAGGIGLMAEPLIPEHFPDYSRWLFIAGSLAMIIWLIWLGSPFYKTSRTILHRSVTIIVWLMVIILFSAGFYIFQKTPERNVLVADNVMTPPWVFDTCTVRTTGKQLLTDNDFIVILGNNVLFTQDLPFTPIFFMSDTIIDNTITLENSNEDLLLVSIKIRSSDSTDLIGNLERNKWIQPATGTLRFDREQHKFTVVDAAEHSVLEVYFMNRRVVQIIGEFGYPGFPHVSISEDQMTIMQPPDKSKYSFIESCGNISLKIGPGGALNIGRYR